MGLQADQRPAQQDSRDQLLRAPHFDCVACRGGAVLPVGQARESDSAAVQRTQESAGGAARTGVARRSVVARRAATGAVRGWGVLAGEVTRATKKPRAERAARWQADCVSGYLLRYLSWQALQDLPVSPT